MKKAINRDILRIAERVSSIHTVITHKKNIFRKLPQRNSFGGILVVQP